MSSASEKIHASAVAHAGNGLMLIGPSGSGKSALALQMMALGAGLVADDRVILTAGDTEITLRCPETIAGLIEARGIGILNAPHAAPATLRWVVDLAQVETARTPPARNVMYLGRNVPLLWRVESPHFAAMLLHLITHGRSSR